MLNGEEGIEYLTYFPLEQNQSLQLEHDRAVIGIEHNQHPVFEFNPKNDQAVSERTLLLQTKSGSLRSIKHIKANNWRDFTCGNEKTITKMLELIDAAQEGKTTPILIHCKGGVGRTGQMVAIHHLRERALHGEPFDVIDTVRQMRDPSTGRTKEMVQRDEQLQFTHRYLLNLAPNN